MTDRELMQQALKALELLAKYENPLTKIQVRKPIDGGPIVTVYPHKAATEAAAPLRERLAQPEQYQRPQMRRATREEKIDRPGVYWVPVEQEQDRNCADQQDCDGRCCIKQPEQEPVTRPCKVGGPCVPTESGPCACRQLPTSPSPVTARPDKEPKCAVIVEVFGKDWRLDYMALPVGKHKLYTQQYTYTAPPQRKPLPPQSPCEMTQAEHKMFKLGWLECEAAHGIKEDA